MFQGSFGETVLHYRPKSLFLGYSRTFGSGNKSLYIDRCNSIRERPFDTVERVSADDPFHMPTIIGNISVCEETAHSLIRK